MKIEFAKNKKIPFTHLSPGQCFRSDDNEVCLACEDGWVVNLATGEMYDLEYPDEKMVVPLSAKLVVLEVE